MKLDTFNVDEFVNINNLKEVTSPVLFQHGIIPDPNGLISNEIFGVTTASRKKTFAYIDLHAPFFHPHVYKALSRMFRNIDKIISGEGYYSLDSEGRIVKDEENGETGIEFLYKNWDKINWLKPKQNPDDIGMSMERVKLVSKLKKEEAFMTKQIVIPAFYRDIRTSSDSNGGSTDDVNNMYIRIIRLVSLIENQDMFDFSFHSTNANIQRNIVDIYDFFKNKIEKKNGMIRKYLMGKNVDYCTRTVITSPSYHADMPEDLFIDFSHAALPVAQVCSLAYPFVVKYVKDFFERELIDNKEAKIIYDPATDTIDGTAQLVDPESYFSDKYIKKMIDTFIRDPESRFNKIEVPTTAKTKRYLYFTGKRHDASNTAELATISKRPMTWCDLLYMAAEYSTRDKHCLITRYPVNNEFNIFPAKIRVASTTKTMPMMVNGYLYPWYPVVEDNVRPEDIPNLFIDATMFSNSYLPGLDGDLTHNHQVSLNSFNCWKLSLG